MSTHPYSSSSQVRFFPLIHLLHPQQQQQQLTNSMLNHIYPIVFHQIKNHFSSLDTSNTTSPISTNLIDTDKIIKDGDVTPSHIFSSPNSFFSNGHKGK